MPDFPVERLLVGRWITSFDVRFTDPPPIVPGAILSCFNFKDNGEFDLERRRNKNGSLDLRPEAGTYTVEWHPDYGVARGEIRIKPPPNAQAFIFYFLMRNRDELRWIMGRESGATDKTPVAQGTMHRVELVKPGT